MSGRGREERSLMGLYSDAVDPVEVEKYHQDDIE